jgi:hypothetical protein
MQANDAVRAELLQEARSRIALPKLIDETAIIAAHNLMYGMGRLIFAIKSVAGEEDIRFWASVDFTITRSPARWGSGFSYGGVLEVRTNIPVVAPEIRPNTCGTLVGFLPRNESQESLVSKVAKFSRLFPPGAWDYSRRNHFVNFYRSRETGRQVVIIHGCPEALRKDNAEGPGLYIDSSEYWGTRSQTFQTPLGPVRLLLEDSAHEYWENYRRCEQISKAHRLSVAQTLFDNIEVISNETHEGMLSEQQYILGCHAPVSPESIFPLMTNIGSPAYLISTSMNCDGGQSMRPSNSIGIIPHGTGYSLPLGSPLEGVDYIDDGTVLYRLCSENGSLQVFRDFSNVPYAYRGVELVQQWITDGLFRVRDTLIPELFTKL